jgi:hypothetical protein
MNINVRINNEELAKVYKILGENSGYSSSDFVDEVSVKMIRMNDIGKKLYYDVMIRTHNKELCEKILNNIKYIEYDNRI